MLIITNGDSAIDQINKTGIQAEITAWKDILHEGPVPDIDIDSLTKIRSEYLAEVYEGSYIDILTDLTNRNNRLKELNPGDELILWFEHDLYDQLQLLQITAWLAENEPSKLKISIICREEYIGENTLSNLLKHFETRILLTGEQLQTGLNVWKAFCSGNPLDLFLASKNFYPEFPYLKNALLRMLEEYPDYKNGLSMTEKQILKVIMNSSPDAEELFTRWQDFEEPKYLGDRSFFNFVKNLSNPSNPLLTYNSSSFSMEVMYHSHSLFKLTDLGVRVLNNEMNYLDLNGIDKWLGGVHLTKDNIWCWDDDKLQIIRMVY